MKGIVVSWMVSIVGAVMVVGAIVGVVGAIKEPDKAAAEQAVICGGVHDERGRAWIPALSGCGPPLSQIDRIELYDGRKCEFVYDQAKWPRTMRGLWCDVTPPSPPLTIAPCDLGNCVVPNPNIAPPPAMDLEGEGDHATIICATPKMPGIPLCEDHST